MSARASVLFVVATLSAEAAAANPRVSFVASGPILDIDTGDVTAAGESGRFVVRERHVTGLFYGDLGGQAGEPFLLTYGSNVPIATQSGQLHGTLTTGGLDGRITARSSVGLTPVPCPEPDGVTCFPSPGGGSFYPGLLLEGTVTFGSGPLTHGTLSGWVIPELDAEGHIVRIIAGVLTIAGEPAR